MIPRRVGTYRFVCCAAPCHLARAGTPRTLGDFEAARSVLNLKVVPRNRWPFWDVDGHAVTAAVHGAIEIDNGEALRIAALEGAGIVYAPHNLVAEDLEAVGWSRSSGNVIP